MPISPIREPLRPGLERVRNASALTAARRLAMVCHKSRSFKHLPVTENDHRNRRRPLQLPLLPLPGIPSSKPLKKSSSQKRTYLRSDPTRHEHFHYVLALYTMMSPKSSWESLRYIVRKMYKLVPLKPPTPALCLKLTFPPGLGKGPNHC